MSDAQPPQMLAPAQTPITVTLPLSSWHQLVALLRKAPWETVESIMRDITAQANPQIALAAAAEQPQPHGALQ